MHLIIQIPAYNEAKTLPTVLADIPQAIPGITRIEVLIIDDGSTDDTVAVAEACNVDYIVQHPYNCGLATAFQTGLNAALRLHADIIVNTDADNQYPASEIPKIVAPIVEGKADIVIGDRQTQAIEHFSGTKRFLQRLGSWVVRLASDTKVLDATSGFRAFSRDAAMRLNILTKYTYTLESIIQAGKKGLTITSVPININPPLRQSRLVLDSPTRFLQSVIVGSMLIIVGFLIFMLGIIGDLIAANRLLIEEMFYHTKRIELNQDISNQAKTRNSIFPKH
ncbi:MAG: hypothetical protein B6242_15275 [Anaerolineaceae bacterium 4572_78]|nr:MAG: hypothetical protein B6242_15275 [Anaerolineaceae bacterium 4572_78]